MGSRSDTEEMVEGLFSSGLRYEYKDFRNMRKLGGWGWGGEGSCEHTVVQAVVWLYGTYGL